MKRPLVYYLTTHNIGSRSVRLLYVEYADYWEKNRELSSNPIEIPLDVQYYLHIGARLTNNLFEITNSSVDDQQCQKAGLVKSDSFAALIQTVPLGNL